MSDLAVISGSVILGVFPNAWGLRVHDRSACDGQPACPIHMPTLHPMRTFRYHWRQDRGLMERTCPHGTGHPDPDQRPYFVQQGHQAFLEELAIVGPPLDHLGFVEDFVSAMETHGCDGCCR